MAITDPWQQALVDEGVIGTPLEKIAMLTRGFESGGRNDAISNRGARGSMQVMPATFSEVADPGWNIDDPYHNMRAGIRYLKQGWEASGGDPALTGAYYYGGPGGMAKARQGVAVSDPMNPNYPNTIQYGQRLAGAFQGTSGMNKSIGQAVPNQLAQMQNELAQMMAQPKFTPELAALLARKSQQDASALPLAIGAMLSGDKGIRDTGALAYQQAQKGRNPIELGDDAYIDPQNGQIINNPIGDVNRSMRALPQAVSLYNNQQTVASNEALRLAQLESANAFKTLGANINLGNLNERIRGNDLTEKRMGMEPMHSYQEALRGIGGSGIGGSGPMMTGAQPRALPMATGQVPMPEQQPVEGAAPQGVAPQSALPMATGQQQQQPPAAAQDAKRSEVIVPELPPNAEMIGMDIRTGENLYRVGGRVWKPHESGGFAQTQDISTTISKPEWDKRTQEVQREAAAMARIKGIIQRLQANPETFGDVVAFLSGATPTFVSDRALIKKLTPEQRNLRAEILRESAQAIHELYGAALTSTEEKRAMGFNVDQTSPPEKVVAALAKTPSYTQKMKRVFGEAVFNAALKGGNMAESDLVFPSYDAAAIPKKGSAAPAQAPSAGGDDIDALINQYLK